jgi:hypothetical protein
MDMAGDAARGPLRPARGYAPATAVPLTDEVRRGPWG